MFYEVITTKPGTCKSCGGPLAQGCFEFFPAWCSTCNSLYGQIRDLIKNRSAVQTEDILEDILNKVIEDELKGIRHKPIRT